MLNQTMRFAAFMIAINLPVLAVAAPVIGCPDGTIQNGVEAPGITQAWCELATDRTQYHGPYRSWYGNGVLGTMENFNHGKREGKAEYHWGNGKLQASGQYRNGERDGNWIFGDFKGDRVGHATYKKGKLISGHEPRWVSQPNASSD